MLEIKVISQETIKPSSPTPHHLRSYKLSWLDKHSPPSHVPLILFYTTTTTTTTHSLLLHTLKQSLSKTLTRFYPLAGRIDGDSLVDCNDEGVDFIEAQVVQTQLSQFLQHPDLEALGQLLPCDHSCSGFGGPGVLLSAQVNTFDCGGIAIGVCVSHKIADGLSVATFLNSWAAVARGSGDVCGPSFDAASLFSPNVMQIPPFFNLRASEKLVTKRFVFDASKIAILRSSIQPSPTRFEAVAALIWRCGMRARGSSRVSVALVVVNMRGRTVPPLPDYSFGNLCTFAGASEVEAGDEDVKRRSAEKLKNAIRKIDVERIKRLEGEDGSSLQYEAVREAAREYGIYNDDQIDEIDLYYFNSWFRFPVYEADFGFGKPVWVGIARFFWKNLILFMGRGDEGMEAWVTLEEKEMVKFEQDPEIISFTSYSSS